MWCEDLNACQKKVSHESIVSVWSPQALPKASLQSHNLGELLWLYEPDLSIQPIRNSEYFPSFTTIWHASNSEYGQTRIGRDWCNAISDFPCGIWIVWTLSTRYGWKMPLMEMSEPKISPAGLLDHNTLEWTLIEHICRNPWELYLCASKYMKTMHSDINTLTSMLISSHQRIEMNK